MIRTTINRFDTKKMFAIWRIDPPWQPLTRYLKEVAQKLPFKAKATSYDLMIQERQREKELEALNVNPYTAEYVIKNNLGGCHNWLSKYDKRWFWKHV